MEITGLINDYLYRFPQIFVRISVMLSIAPFFGGRIFPIQYKAGLAVAMSVMFTPLVKTIDADPILMIIRETFLGAALGLSIRFIFAAVETAAQWISIVMGFSAANVFDPQFGNQHSPLSELYSLLSMVIFFVIDAHHIFITAIVKSFEIHFEPIRLFSSIIAMSQKFFTIAVKLSAPVMLSQTLANIMLGFMSKAMPQANVIFVGFPLLISIGLIVTLLSFPLTLSSIAGFYYQLKFVFTNMLGNPL